MSPQERWARHVLSCAVCHAFEVADRNCTDGAGVIADLCDVGARIWSEVCAEPSPQPVEAGTMPAQLAPVEDTQPYPSRSVCEVPS